MLVKLKNLDIPILFILACFLVISTFVIYSATYGTKYQGLHINNAVMFLVLLIPMLLIACMDYRIVVRHLSWILYGISILLLVYVMFKGMTINGSRRWINLGIMQFQPSELAKVSVILLAAKLLEKRNGDTLHLFKDLNIKLFQQGL
ncbi:FtsW/RodA/SpoVE family cell cycle protein [Paenibacillus sp. GP183]|uniref:FtsW/RodA/SpoVE family cell cycle protein n=1 Tax=Paenibacillus sp. GP183 TaxID=1882751 RepID=UPI00209BB049|nr:FtsW/RodA/SpoVE family cell cycle protein [Paenibacillus sp. GP183]